MENNTNTQKQFFKWSLIALVIALALLFIPDWISNGYHALKQAWQDAAARQESQSSEQTATSSGFVGVVTEGENAGMEVDMSDALLVYDEIAGNGAEAKNGDHLSMHYVGTLLDGTKFDSSVDRGQPFEFTLGAGEVIQGWDEGIVGMKVGGKRRLVIPASMAYGNQSVGLIPANSTLVFEVELLGIN